jgi:hypothetical protein
MNERLNHDFNIIVKEFCLAFHRMIGTMRIGKADLSGEMVLKSELQFTALIK